MAVAITGRRAAQANDSKKTSFRKGQIWMSLRLCKNEQAEKKRKHLVNYA